MTAAAAPLRQPTRLPRIEEQDSPGHYQLDAELRRIILDDPEPPIRLTWPPLQPPRRPITRGHLRLIHSA